jgi:hypothetical protein
MIIKSHIRGGYRSAAEYLKEQGKNEETRLVEISDPSAKNLDDAFHNMWVVASNTKATKPLHHISINPMKDERLTDKQVMAIVARCEEKYGYKMFHHQRVIVEHVKDGRQHFHVIWNRVSLMTGSTVWPGEHWKKSKQICREMEQELGLKRPTPRRMKKGSTFRGGKGRKRKTAKNHTTRGAGKYAKAQRHQKKTNRYKKFNPTSNGLSARKSKFGKTSGIAFSTPKGLANYRPAVTSDNGGWNLTGHNGGLSLPKPAPHTPVHIKPSKETSTAYSEPFRPTGNRRGWPPAAVIDWETWGKRSPQRFFALWPELSI